MSGVAPRASTAGALFAGAAPGESRVVRVRRSGKMIEVTLVAAVHP